VAGTDAWARAGAVIISNARADIGMCLVFIWWLRPADKGGAKILPVRARDKAARQDGDEISRA
jgi:hypothetical protein